MNQIFTPFRRRLVPCIVLFVCFMCVLPGAYSQMRQVFVDNVQDQNDIKKVSFYSASSGYVAFRDWIGYTTDTGRSFVQKYITINNVNYNGYPVNLTFGFGIQGVHAFNQNTIVVYGDYGAVPAILHSTDGGNTFLLVYHSALNLNRFAGITDMVFPGNGNTGYAVEADRIIRSTNGGLNWTVIRNDPNSFFDYIEAADQNTLVAFSVESGNKIVKITNGVNSRTVSLPPGFLNYVHFISADKGWANSGSIIYYTSDGGNTWTRRSKFEKLGFAKMKFLNDSTGYALGGRSVWKTTDSGRVWEQLPRDNDFDGVGWHNDLSFWSPNQFWAGGGNGFLELTTNAGGTPYPLAGFGIDTSGSHGSVTVHLTTYSKPFYTHQWYLNGLPIGAGPEISYVHSIYPLRDTITLIVSNGTYSDTATAYQEFHPPAGITSFTPTSAASGAAVTINGTNLSSTTQVYFGGTPAAGFSVESAGTLTATVASGSASGYVKVVTAVNGVDSLDGFTYFAQPVITGFSPVAAKAGTVVTITGFDFVNVEQVRFAGVPAANFIVVSPTTIAAVAPSGQSGSITVKAPGGTASFPGFVALPTLTAFTPSVGTEGTILKIEGNSLTETAEISVGGIPVKTFTVKSANSVWAEVNSGATGSVILATTGGKDTLAGFTYIPPPVITGFTPSSGAVGSAITITGSNFHAVPGNNVVYFGAVKANVLGGTTTSLTVEVPAGATYDPISVTSNYLTAYTKQAFVTTFAGGGKNITPNAFTRHDMLLDGNHPTAQIEAGDVDGDGKPDLIMRRDGITIIRNISANGTLALDTTAPFKIFAASYWVAVGDLDRDGRLDLAAPGASGLVVYRNTSSPGNISFAAPEILSLAPGEGRIYIADMDVDGKPDIIAGGGGITVFRNIGEPGALAFDVSVHPGGGAIYVRDVDIDNKPDVIYTSWSTNGLFIYKNTSTRGSISFSSPITPVAHSPYMSAAGDIDGDGLPDIAVAGLYDSAVNVYRNTGTPGNPVFTDSVRIPVGASVEMVNLSDLNGDGKADLAVKTQYLNLALLTNTSTPGDISFEGPAIYDPEFTAGDFGVELADLNLDQKPEAIVVSQMGRLVNIYVNNSSPRPYIRQFTPAMGLQGAVVTITGNHFTGTTSVTFGGIPAASFTVTSDTSITAVVGTGATGSVIVSNADGVDSLTGFLLGIPPVITSVSPASGPVGASITIAGSGFDAIAANNIVYVGGIRTTVTAAGTNSLTVTVPAGAAPENISVTVNNLTARSGNPFIVTFKGDTTGFTPNSFVRDAEVQAAYAGNVADINSDGKADLLLLHGNFGVGVALNTSVSGQTSFGQAQWFDPGSASAKAVAADLNGDGKPDLVLLDKYVNSFGVLINTSTSGNVSFSPRMSFSIGPDPLPSNDITVFDLDEDGRPDLLATKNETHNFTVLKNLSTPDHIQFERKFVFDTPGYPLQIRANDLDGDGKPDIVAAVQHIYGRLGLYRNTSTDGNMSFAEMQIQGIADSKLTIAVADLDNDGLSDVIATNGAGHSSEILLNTSTPGTISFGWGSGLSGWNNPGSPLAGDLDGDGRQDLVIAYWSEDPALYKNISIPGNLRFASGVSYADGSSITRKNSLCDMDGDGVLDIIDDTGNRIYIHRNLTGEANIVQICPGSDTALTSTLAGFNNQWQMDDGAGFVNMQNNSNASGVTTSKLTLLNVPASWDRYRFRCVTDGIPGRPFTLSVTGAAVLPAVAVNITDTVVCSGSTITFTAIPENGGSAPTYQWKVNDADAGGNGNTYSLTNISANAEVYVVMTSNSACASPATVHSDTISVTISAPVVPEVNITASEDTVCTGALITFTATAQNEGDAPVYQWTRNGTNAGTNSPVFTDNSLADGDLVQVQLISNANCASPALVFSNTIPIVTRNEAAITIAGNTNATAGNPIPLTSMVTDAGTAPVFQWQDSTDMHNWQNIAGATGPTHVYTAQHSGTGIRCLLITDLCGMDTAYSNTLAVTLTSGARIVPNPVGNMLQIEDVRLSDNWDVLEIVQLSTGKVMMKENITGQTTIALPVTGLPGGIYLAVFKRSSGPSGQLKFLKL